MYCFVPTHHHAKPNGRQSVPEKKKKAGGEANEARLNGRYDLRRESNLSFFEPNE